MDESKFAAGQVGTGFSFPVVSLYNNNGGTVTYTNGMDLARGVGVDPDIETSNDDNTFYANNRSAETAQKRFRRGNVALTVDGLLRAAEKLCMGLPAPSTITVGKNEVEMTDYGDDQNIPYMGLGFVYRSQSNGVDIYRAWFYTKARFDQFVIPAATEEEDIDWQTTELNAQLNRDDTPKHNWQRISQPLATELEAYNVVRRLNGMEPVNALPIDGPATATVNTTSGQENS